MNLAAFRPLCVTAACLYADGGRRWQTFYSNLCREHEWPNVRARVVQRPLVWRDLESPISIHRSLRALNRLGPVPARYRNEVHATTACISRIILRVHFRSLSRIFQVSEASSPETTQTAALARGCLPFFPMLHRTFIQHNLGTRTSPTAVAFIALMPARIFPQVPSQGGVLFSLDDCARSPLANADPAPHLTPIQRAQCAH